MTRHTKAVSAAFFLALFMSLALLSSISAGSDKPLLYAKLAWSLAVAYTGLCIYRHGMISKYRSILFMLIAFFFFLQFKFLRFMSIGNCTPPYCHIALAPTLLNFIHSQYLALASGDWRTWGVLTMGFFWLLIMFTIGQGICSWVCFYGGWDESCSKLLRKPLIRVKVSKRWRDFPIAFLVFLLIISFLQGLPAFCNWFCPFKLTTAFWDSYPVVRTVQAVLFWSFLVGSVILLPVLTKKRTFCSLICPFGALVSICGKAGPHKVTINKERCVACGKCRDVCPIFAIENEDPGEYRISDFCNRCGKCIDICPVDAINILSGPAGQQVDTQDIFIFLSLLVTGVISGTFVPRVMMQLMGLK